MNNLTQQQKDQVVADVFIKAIKNKWNILQLSKMIGRTVVSTSKLVSEIHKQYPSTWGKVIEKLGWPLNITSGHIYAGGYSTPIIDNPAIYKIDAEIRLLIKNQLSNPDSNWLSKAKELLKKKRDIVITPLKTGGSLLHGERLDKIKPGMHVIAKPIIGKPFHEIFLPISTKQYLFRFGHLIDGQFKKSDNKSAECWFSKQDIIDGKITDYSITHKYTRVERAKPVRTIYAAGKPMGTVHNRYLVSVNSDGT